MTAVPPSSPSRRHFIGIAAAAARKLSMLSVSVSALSLLGARDVAAHGYEHERHHLWHLYGQRHGVSHGDGFGSGGPSMSGAGGRSGYSNGSRSGGNGSGSASGSGSAGSRSGSASGSGTSGTGSGSASGSNSAANGSGTTNGSGTSASGAVGSGSTFGSGSDGYGTGGVSGSGSSSSGSVSAGLRCFAPGTLILTEAGEVPVENLLIGMQVMTTNGPMPVKWIGRQTLKRNQAAAWHPRVLPVRVAQFAIDDQTPSRDVCLSQSHSLFVDGVLIPARHLVNGRSIRFDEQALAAETLEYFHVELDTHEIIFADGLPVESYMYAGGTVAWDNHGDYLRRYGEHRIMAPFAPIHSYEGGFDELGGLIRLMASRIVDIRDPIQIAHDRLKERSLLRAA